MTNAQAAQQSNRSNDGRYATKVADESDVDIAAPNADLSRVPHLIGDTPDSQTPEAARLAYEAAVAARNVDYDMIDAVCTERGAHMLATAFDVIRDRETIPASRLVADMTGGLFWSHNDAFDVYGYDKIADHYAGSGPDSDDEVMDDETFAHVKAACAEAGLGSMERVYGRLADNGLLAIRDAKSLDADAVEADYERFIAPAIDRVEQNMREDYVFDVASREQSRAFDVAEKIADPALTARVTDKIYAAGEEVYVDTNNPQRLRILAEVLESSSNLDVPVDDLATKSALRASAERLRSVATALNG